MERRQVFHYILFWSTGENRHIIDYLYHRYIDADATDIADKITSLRDAMDGDSAENIPPYHRWTLPTSQNRRLLLPRSDAFQQQVVNQRTALVTREVTQQITRLDEELRQAVEIATQITQLSQRAGTLLSPYSQETGMIEIMGQFLAIAEAQPSESIDQGGYDDLQENVSQLKTQAREKFSSEPTQTIARLKRQIRRHSDDLYRRLQDPDSSLMQAFGAVIRQENNILPNYVSEASRQLGACYRVLSMTDKADQFVEQDLIPILSYLAEQNSNQTATTVFERFSSGLGALAGWLGYVPLMVGNLPGPPSAFMVIVESAIPVIIRLGAEDRAKALLFRSVASRNIATWLGIVDDDLPTFLNKLTTTNADELVGWQRTLGRRSERIINSEVMSSPGWGVVMSIVNGFLLLNAVCQASTWNEASVVRRIQLMADIAGNSANTLMSLSVMLQNSERIQRVAPAALSTTTSQRLGLFAAIAATVSSAAVMYQELETRDYTGAALAGLGVISGLLAVAGWLAVMGVITAPVGVGEVLLVISFVVAVLAGLISLFTSDTSCDVLFESFVQGLKDRPNFNRFRQINNADGRALQAKFAAVEADHHTVTIEAMTNTARIGLEALFAVDQITNQDDQRNMREMIDGLIA